ncbi:MAG: response regulator transcription factor [Sphingobacteriales bacterium]|nr:MAG: response regulator transcription factor [Sphingobacteriales bacterium]
MLSEKINIIFNHLLEQNITSHTFDLSKDKQIILNYINKSTYKIILHDTTKFNLIIVNDALKTYLDLDSNFYHNNNLVSLYFNIIHINNFTTLGEVFKHIHQKSTNVLIMYLTISKDRIHWKDIYSISKIMFNEAHQKPKYLLTILEENHRLPKKNKIEFNTKIKHISYSEQKILKYLYHDLTTKEIADLLHVSVYTINTHRQNLIKKLEVKSSHGLVRKAIELGLTTPIHHFT